MSDILDSISSAVTELTAPRTLASLAEKDAEQIARVLYVFIERPLNNIPTSVIKTIIAKLNAAKLMEPLLPQLELWLIRISFQGIRFKLKLAKRVAPSLYLLLREHINFRNLHGSETIQSSFANVPIEAIAVAQTIKQISFRDLLRFLETQTDCVTSQSWLRTVIFDRPKSAYELTELKRVFTKTYGQSFVPANLPCFPDARKAPRKRRFVKDDL